jgi:hypothetical protein
VKFNPAHFNRFLDVRGDVTQAFAWRKRSACPCTSESSNSPRYDCPVCNGKGHVWAEEVAGNAGLTGQSPTKAIALFGTYETGDAVMTIPGSSPMYAARQYDRFRALGSTEPFSTAMRRGLGDRINGQVKNIDRVFWYEDDGQTVHEGGIPTVGAHGVLTWTSGEPPQGKSYTVEGVRWEEFFVFNQLSSDRNVGVAGLPMKLGVRKIDLLLR